MKREASWWEKWRLSFLMILVSLLGIILILVAYILETRGKGDWQLLRDIGVGFLVAGILGITVDQVLKRQLARDAFKASIGYILPDELKGEMEWIYETHVLCVQHIQICKLTPIDDEYCKLHVTMHRTFQNISLSRTSIDKPGVGLDEWFHKVGSSQILRFGYVRGEEKWEADKNNFSKTECGWEIKDAKKISLAPNEEVTISFETEEIKRTNDANYWAFGYPTRSPQVIVEGYDGIHMKVRFGYRLPAELLGSNTYRLTGTLLPDQRVEIRWWKEKDSANWRNQSQDSVV